MIESRKLSRADRHCKRTLLRMGWRALLEPHRQLQSRETAVREQRKWNLCRAVWRAWCGEVAIARAVEERRFRFAREHFGATLKCKALAAWQEGAKVLREERRADLRRRQMRSRVDLWLQEERASRDSVKGRAEQLLDGRAVNSAATRVARNPYR